MQDKLGKKAFKKKDFDTAISHYMEALSLNPTEVSYPNLGAKAKFEQKSTQSALSFVKKRSKWGRKTKET